MKHLAIWTLRHMLASSTILLLLVGAAFSQSGRHKEPDTPRSQPAPPATDSNRPRRSTGDRTQSTTAKQPSNKQSNGEIDSSDVVRVRSSLVPIPASIVDLEGYAVSNLRLDDFELRVDGQVRPITDLIRADTPVRMVMLFDNSGSIDFAREFEKQAAMKFFSKVMRPSDQAAIYSVGTENYLAQPMTGDIRRLEQTIASFGRPGGSTSLFDAIIDAADYVRPLLARRVLVIVSDGIETTSRADFETTMQRVLTDDCEIFVVQTGLYDGANVRALAAERRMEQLSTQTGGAVYIPRSTGELDSAFQQIAADLSHQYVLSYYPGGENQDGRFHIIELRVKSRTDVRVRARRGYYARKPYDVAAHQ